MSGGFIVLILVFFLLRFLFRHVLPVVQVFSAAQRKMRGMQTDPNEDSTPQPERKQRAPKKGDYIEFEEVK